MSLSARVRPGIEAAPWVVDQIKQLEEKCNALQAKVEAMEKQEPIAWMNSRNGFICKDNKNPDYNVPLVPLPDAKGEEK